MFFTTRRRRMRPRHGTLLMILLLLLSLAATAGEPFHGSVEAPRPAPPLQVAALLSEAVKANPVVRAARERWEAARAMVDVVKAPPDLRVGLQYAQVPGFARPDTVGQGYVQVMLSQTIPGWGKLSAAEQVALRHAAVEAARLDETMLDVKTTLRRQLDDLFLTDALIKVNKTELQVVAQIVKIAEIQYSVGKGTQADVIQGQTEQTRITNLLIGLAQQRRQEVARINRSLSRKQGQALGSVAQPQLPALDRKLDALEALAREKRPALAAARLAVEQARAGLVVARRAANPDVTVSLAERLYQWRGDGVMLQASVPLPFVNEQKYQAMATGAKAKLDEARAAHQMAQDQVDADIEEALSAYHQHRQQTIVVKRTLLPQARETLKVALSDYETGQVNFNTVLAAETTILKVEDDYYTHLVKAHKALVTLEGDVGTRLVQSAKEVPHNA